MSTLRNSVQLIGHAGQDAELVTLKSGQQLAKFSLATNESYKNKDGEWQDKTAWHNLQMWGPGAERAVANIQKGTQLVIKGKIAYSESEDKDGAKRYFTNIVVREYVVLTKREKKELAEAPF